MVWRMDQSSLHSMARIIYVLDVLIGITSIYVAVDTLFLHEHTIGV